MTPVALAYLLAGLVAFVWPLLLLLHKRQVLGAQWLFMLAMVFIGSALVLYSCLFNSFLHDEYLIVIMFMGMALLAPPMMHIAVSALTRPNGVSRRVRAVFVPPMAVGGLMVLAVAIGGPDMYRMWIVRGAQGEAWRMFVGSWRYDLIVAIHYYLFCVAIVVEVLLETLYSFRQIRRLRKLYGEYFPSHKDWMRTGHRLCVVVAALGLLVLVSLVLFPFNSARPVAVVVGMCVAEAALLLLAGWDIYHLTYGAERLADLRTAADRPRGDLMQLGRQIADYVERERAFLNPDISVFMLADRFRVPEDEVVDAIHRMHGLSFGDYIDGQRIELSTVVMLSQMQKGWMDDTMQREILAHQCGYLDAAAFEQAFLKVMQQPVERWYEANV